MKGLQLLLQSLGIKIEPSEIEDAFQKGKSALPELVEQAKILNTRLDRIEAKMELLLSRTGGEVQPDPIHEQVLNGHSPETILQEVMRGR